MITRLKLSTIEQGLPKYRSMLAGNDAYIPNSFESIATATSTGSSATITFSSIPSTYQHLQIRGRFSGSGGLLLTMNGSSSAIYTNHKLQGDGTSATAGGGGYGAGYMNLTTTPVGSATALHYCIIDIHDYGSTTKNKTLRMIEGYDNNDTNGKIVLWSGLFGSTNAVTSLTLDANGTFANNTTFALYGIKGA